MNFIAKYLIIASFLMFYYNSFGQKRKIDSLQNLISNEKIDSNKIKLNNELAWVYFQDKQSSKSKKIVLENIEKAKKLKWNKGIAYSYETIGDFYYYENKSDSAISLFKISIEYYKKTNDFPQICYMYDKLGEHLAHTHKYSEAKPYLVEGLDLAVKIKNVKYQIYCLEGLGSLYHEMGNFEKSLDYFFQAEKLAIQIKNKQKQIDISLGIGRNYIGQGRNKEAQIKYFEVAQYYKNINDLYNYAKTLSTAANLYRRINQPEKAEKYLFEVYEIQKDLKDTWNLITTSRYLGMLYTDKKKYKEAENYLNESLKLANQYKNGSDKIRAYYTLERLYYAKNDFKEGDKYQKKIIQMRDSLYTADNNKALAEFDVKYKTAEKEKQLAESKLEIAQNRNWIIGLGIAFLSILGFGLLFWRIQKDKQKAILQDLEIENTRKILNAREIERQRIAKELHDSVGSQLTVVSTSLDNAFFLAENHRLVPQKLESINVEVREAAQSLRDTIWATHNTVIPISNLYARMQHYLNKVFSENEKIIHQATLSGADEDLNSIEALNLFRIFQESVQNIQKHSEATVINLTLENTDQHLKLSISDNGKGFEINDKNPFENFGLSNMKIRSEEINASLSISSKINAGTVIEVLLNKKATE